MTLEQYNDAVKQIMADQQTIAQSTVQLAMAGSAHPGNAQFTELMGKQWALAQQMAKLNSDLMLGIFSQKKA